MREHTHRERQTKQRHADLVPDKRAGVRVVVLLWGRWHGLARIVVVVDCGVQRKLVVCLCLHACLSPVAGSERGCGGGRAGCIQAVDNVRNEVNKLRELAEVAIEDGEDVADERQHLHAVVESDDP